MLDGMKDAELARVANGYLRLMRAPEANRLESRAGGVFGFAAGSLVVALVVYGALWLLHARHAGGVAMESEHRLVALPLVPISPKPVVGLLRFRGNPTHTYYGRGPLPENPRLLWRFPGHPMCSESWVGNDPKIWCGTGWTGQPAVWVRPDGISEVIVGAFDRAVHFLDLDTGRRTRPDFVTGDIIKGSVTIDPDGDPLIYFGSRDNKLRIVALDRGRPVELWKLDADFVPGIWNNDWDGNPLVLNDMLYEGGENGYLFAFRLHLDYGPGGRVRVRPELLAALKGWNEELLEKVGDRNASIESSVAAFGKRLYFTNSAGRVVGVDTSQIDSGRAPVVFDFWMGDDIDASVVIDETGMLYVAAELERYLPRSDEVGQLVKLDPYTTGDPVVWSLGFPPALGDWKGGIWSTPALDDEALYLTTNSGMLAIVDRRTGEILFTDDLGPHAWSSPALVDDQLIVATCKGQIRDYNVEDPRRPILKWTVTIPSGACIESTPAIWDGRIVVGARDGYLYAFGD